MDEEVYGNDGVERHEAREASAGDRRAIADADQAGQLDISGEAKTASSLRTPEPPTDAARVAHPHRSRLIYRVRPCAAGRWVPGLRRVAVPRLLRPAWWTVMLVTRR